MKAGFWVGLAVVAAGCAGATHPQPTTPSPGPPPLRVRNTAIVSTQTADAIFPKLLPSGAASDGHGGWYVVGNGLFGILHADGHVTDWGHPALLPCGVIRSGPRLIVPIQEGRVAAFSVRSRERLWISGKLRRQIPGIGCSREVMPVAAGGARVYVAAGRRVVALDPRTGRILDWRASMHMDIHALAPAGKRLYVGGSRGLVAVDADTGRRLSWRASRRIDNVDTLLVTHGMIFTAGFDTVGVLSERTGRVLPLTRKAGGTTYAVNGKLLYVGGDIRAGNAVQPGVDHNLGAFDLSSRTATPWAPRLDNYVNVGAIVPSGDHVLVLGTFENTIG